MGTSTQATIYNGLYRCNGDICGGGPNPVVSSTAWTPSTARRTSRYHDMPYACLNPALQPEPIEQALKNDLSQTPPSVACYGLGHMPRSEVVSLMARPGIILQESMLRLNHLIMSAALVRLISPSSGRSSAILTKQSSDIPLLLDLPTCSPSSKMSRLFVDYLLAGSDDFVPAILATFALPHF